jgi:hypothetical protein
LPRNFLAGATFEVAENQRQAVHVWELAQLLVEERLQLPERVDRHGRSLRHFSHLLLAGPTSNADSVYASCGPERNAIKPIPDGFPWRDRGCLAGEDEKGRLKCVFGVVDVTDNSLTESQDHRAVASNQHFEGRLVPPREEALQQLAVRQANAVLQVSGLAQVTDHDLASHG